MNRARSLLALCLLGCGDDAADGVGSLSGDSATSAPTTAAPTGSTGVTGAPGSTGDSSSGSGAGTQGTTADGGTTSGSKTTTDAASSTGDPPDTGGLGECIGIGVWFSCADYCGAVMGVCVPDGCVGGTAHYYDDASDCSARRGGTPESHGCADPLLSGGTISFARCCCE